jgi:DNA replication protein DnaC
VGPSVSKRAALLLNTDLPFEKWVEMMGGHRLTGALLGRLTHRAHIIEANGPSY